MFNAKFFSEGSTFYSYFIYMRINPNISFKVCRLFGHYSDDKQCNKHNTSNYTSTALFMLLKELILQPTSKVKFAICVIELRVEKMLMGFSAFFFIIIGFLYFCYFTLCVRMKNNTSDC